MKTNMLLTGLGSARIVKNYDLGLENVFSSSRFIIYKCWRVCQQTSSSWFPVSIVQPSCMFACIVIKLWVDVSTHFLARDHYAKYLHILGMKMKEILIFGQGFSWSKLNIPVKISKDKAQMWKASIRKHSYLPGKLSMAVHAPCIETSFMYRPRLSW